MRIVYEMAGWQCRRCHARTEPVLVQKGSNPELPEGWRWVDVHDCGMTGYSERRLYCPLCHKNGDE